MPSFRQLHGRLVATLQDKVRSGEITERGVARLTGLSQPHVHNVLKGKRYLSADAADAILTALHLDTLHLLESGELIDALGRR